MSFFEKYKKLQLKTPRIALNNTRAVNSVYANGCINNKNCYMIFGSDHNEDLMYSTWVYDSKDCTDCSFVRKSELCYECTDCHECYNCEHLQDCDNCRDSAYLYGCTGCANCFLCASLIRKEYCIMNEQYGRDEYFARVREITDIEAKFEEIQLRTPRKFARALNNEKATGDYIYHCKNTHDSFDVEDCEDSGHLYCAVYGIKDCYDVTYLEHAELCYEGISNWGFNMNFCNACWYCANLEYCDFCQDCKDCFGCISLKGKQYYILNEPYERDEYFARVKEIKDELRARNEYNRVFPESPFKREDTAFMDYYD